MGKEMVSVYEHLSVTESILELRKQAEDIENVYTVYVTDEKDRLKGRLALKKMLVAPTSAKIKDVYVSDIHWVKAGDTTEEVASIMEKYDLVALPVVDNLHRLIGRITIDDVVDVIKEEADRDYQMASGISEDVESTDSVWVLTRARLPWLILGLIGGIFGARVIGLYEADIQLYPEMAFFIPLVAAMGGNVGVQSSAIIVQGLANNTMGMSGILPRLLKEFSVALLNATACAIIVLGYNIIFGDSLNLAYTVSLALLAVIVIAALFGTLIPLTLDKYKIDPALATGPFITTVNDILGLFIYFMIGRLMYGM
jgi:magnesium transporter